MPKIHIIRTQSEVNETLAAAERQDQPVRSPEDPGGGSGDRAPDLPRDIPEDPGSDSEGDRSNSPEPKSPPTRGPEDPGGGSGGGDSDAVLPSRAPKSGADLLIV